MITSGFMKHGLKWLAIAGAGLALTVGVAHSRVTKIVVSQTTSPLFSGQAFGAVGQYEMLRGMAYGEIDPADRRNAVITDIALAPRNANGKVEYSVTFTMLKPVEMANASGVMLYVVPNRGGGGSPPFHMGGNPGDGFTYNRGLVILWSGWQGDLIPTGVTGFEIANVPIAKLPDGSPVTSPAIARFLNIPGNVNTYPLAGDDKGGNNISRVFAPITLYNGSVRAGFRAIPATLDTTKAKLTSRRTETRAGVSTDVAVIPSTDFAFADCTKVPFPGTPDPNQLCLKSGFNPDLIYQLDYIAKDPFVLGVGMAAMRDVSSFFRNEAKDDLGTANPVAGKFKYVISTGSSQSGRYIKQFLNLGFNEDEKGKRVWDGANANIPGALGSFNVRFGSPGNIADPYDTGTDGPLWWEDHQDTVRNRPKWGLLTRCRQTNTCPLITETYGGGEYWYGRGSIGLTGPEKTADIPVPENVRRYYYPSTTHGGGTGTFLLTTTPAPGGVLPQNPNHQAESNRALFVALLDWVTKGVPPPPSAYPRIADGTLVPATSAAMGWPTIPGYPSPDGMMAPLVDYDFGPQFNYNDDSGVITTMPPPVRQVIIPLAPKVDSDGNEIAGVRSLLLRLPLGTYTGWQPIATGSMKGEAATLSGGGGWIPFKKTKAERLAVGDPRPSVEERYSSLWGYYYLGIQAANELVAQRYLLPEDASRLINRLLSDVLRTGLLPKHGEFEAGAEPSFAEQEESPPVEF